ncbi:emp24/gp25L/p24 family/GOLD-domain-containing protein [Hyaloraphidium curvatum]|nr:emp24/gp25L/p24 family/GOLD-domain-containing protein [Hyaloraphidium curvatum]
MGSATRRTRFASRFASALLLVAVLALSLGPARALHFYLEGSEEKCFIEELPKDTHVVGTYRTEEFNENIQKYGVNPSVAVQITVEELPDRHRVLNQKGAAQGKFTFTSADAGDHAICLSTSASSGWFTRSKIRFHLELSIGDSPAESSGNQAKELLGDLAMKVRELNSRVQNIRREQQYQREREAEFRDTSELTNSRVIYWTIAQLLVLGITAYWQLSHLQKFFISKKIV